MAKNADSDTLRLVGSPAKSQRKVLRGSVALLKESVQLGCEIICFTERRNIGIKTELLAKAEEVEKHSQPKVSSSTKRIAWTSAKREQTVALEHRSPLSPLSTGSRCHHGEALSFRFLVQQWRYTVYGGVNKSNRKEADTWKDA